MASFSEPLAKLVNYFGSLQTIKGELERLEDVYNYPLGDSEHATCRRQSAFRRS